MSIICEFKSSHGTIVFKTGDTIITVARACLGWYVETIKVNYLGKPIGLIYTNTHAGCPPELDYACYNNDVRGIMSKLESTSQGYKIKGLNCTGSSHRNS